MTRHFAIVLFCALPALPQGGAIPKGASAYQPLEVSNVRWLSPPTAKEAAVFRKGNMMIDGEEGFTFNTLDGEELRVSYRSITGLQYGVVARPPKPVKARQPKAPKSVAAPAPVPAAPAECAVPEGKLPEAKERGKLTGWMPRMGKVKKLAPSKMPSLTPSLPVGSLELLTVTYRKGGRTEQAFLELHKSNATYLLNAISGRATVPVKRVGFRDPWTPMLKASHGAASTADDE